jgi:hypothetical protein
LALAIGPAVANGLRGWFAAGAANVHRLRDGGLFASR